MIIPICVGLFYNYEFRLFARVQEYYENKKTVVIPSVLAAALNLILNYIFIRRNGYQAAAYTTFICYFVFCIIHYIFYRRTCNEKNHGISYYNDKHLMLISVVVVMGGFFVSLINSNFFLKYAFIILIMMVLLQKKKNIISYLGKIANDIKK